MSNNSGQEQPLLGSHCSDDDEEDVLRTTANMMGATPVGEGVEGNKQQQQYLSDSEDDEHESACVICYNSMEAGNRSLVSLCCGHKFHFSCVGTYFNRTRKMECPYCRKVDTTAVWKLAQLPPVVENTTPGEDDDLKKKKVTPGGPEENTGCCTLCKEEFGTVKPTVDLVACGHKFHFACLGEHCNNKNRVECPTCLSIEEGDWWHCPYGIHSSDAIDDNVIINNYIANTQQNDDELEDEESLVTHSNRRGCLCCCCCQRWLMAWVRGARGELRSMRVIVILLLMISMFSALRSPYAGPPPPNNNYYNPHSNKNDAKAEGLAIIYLLSTLVPMVLFPGALMAIPAVFYICIFVFRTVAHVYGNAFDLTLEPIAALCCCFMLFFWIRCNRANVLNWGEIYRL